MKDFIDPYHAVGLKSNPFVAERMSGVDPGLWVDSGFSSAPAKGERLFIQFLGEKGAGKTSHLLHWRSQTNGSYSYFPDSWERWYLPKVDEISYWDEANRIPFPLLAIALKQAYDQKSTIVAGTHNDLAWIARAIGFRKIKTIRLETISLEMFLAWVEKRLEAVQLSPEIEIKLRLERHDALKILSQSGASWRRASVYLHIWAAEQVERFANLDRI
jgi:hypothetical protein